MFWDLYRLIPSIHDAPALLSMLGVTGVPDWAVRFCTTPIWLSRLAIIFPFVAGTMLVAGAFLVRWINRSAVQAIIGAAAVIIGAVILGRMIGGYVALVLLLGLSIPTLIAGAGIVLKRPTGPLGKSLPCVAALILVLFTTVGIVFLIRNRHLTFRDRFGAVDPIIGLTGMSLLLVAGLIFLIALAAGGNPSSRTVMRVSRWLCIVTILALPIYAVTRGSLLIRDQTEQRLRQANTLMASSLGSERRSAPANKGRASPPGFSEYMSRMQLPQIDSTSVARTFALLAGKLLAFTYLFFWLLGSGLAGLLCQPSALRRPAEGRM
jgi:hypothetical protein